jgi:hypothetical protein
MIGEGYRLEKIAKKPPHLGLGFQKTTTFQENFKKNTILSSKCCKNTDHAINLCEATSNSDGPPIC